MIENLLRQREEQSGRHKKEIQRLLVEHDQAIQLMKLGTQQENASQPTSQLINGDAPFLETSHIFNMEQLVQNLKVGCLETHNQEVK